MIRDEGTRETNRILFWCCVVVGGSICLYGLRGLIHALDGIASREFLQWFVGADVAHDLLIAPISCLVGAVIARLVPGSARAHVRAGVFASAIVLVVAWAPLHGYGHTTAPGNSSVQPLRYATAVPTVLAAVWVIVGLWLALTLIRRRRLTDPNTTT